jgi:hypothetical protein
MMPEPPANDGAAGSRHRARYPPDVDAAADKRGRSGIARNADVCGTQGSRERRPGTRPAVDAGRR